MALNGQGKTKVAILGGGAAGVTAAYELTATEELREKYDVTLYTLGWRLGGKCASGRNADFGYRIEEHGLHVWFGFYDNAFGLMRRVYGELESAGAASSSFADAFKPCDEIVLCEEWNGRWHTRPYKTPPRNGLEPGFDEGDEGDEGTVSFWSAASTLLGWVVSMCGNAVAKKPAFAARAGLGEGLPSEVHDAREAMLGVGVDVQAADGSDATIRPLRLVHRFLHVLADEKEKRLQPFHVHQLLLLSGLCKIRDAWAGEIQNHLDDDDLREAYMALDLATAGIRGMISDDLVFGGLDRINDQDLGEWLVKHHADQDTVDHAPWLRGFYDLAFAYEGGDTSKPNIAAGAALRAIISMTFAYKGAMLWKMQGGMGDVVFAPLYEVLRDRVNFEFFSDVRRLKLSADKRRVEEIELLPQVQLSSEPYDPLIDLHGVKCWPSEPKWDLIKDSNVVRDRLQALGCTLEWEGSTRRAPGAAPRLRRGEDFDEVILAMSIGSLGPICQELSDNPGTPAFHAMLENSHTVMTQAFQLWANRPVTELGWCYKDDSITGSYVEPLDTYSSMDQLLACEHWTGVETPQHIAYFCGVMQDLPDGARETPAQAKARAYAHALDYTRDDLAKLWTACGAGGFDWSVLIDGNGGSGEARLRAQYWRANLAGSERYVTTPKGSVDFRLKPHESGYDNLWLAGDWTRTGIDGGCVEAAVISGMKAAHALTDGECAQIQNSPSPLKVGR
jgi:uncharacterized protein with NAD-binding domain and iron-sulfur cluster